MTEEIKEFLQIALGLWFILFVVFSVPLSILARRRGYAARKAEEEQENGKETGS